MRRIKKKMKKRTPIYLPHDIIENILSRLSVKSLLRFKTVCKQWKVTISDPGFAETHLRRSNNSCLLADAIDSDARAQLFDLENNIFRLLSAVDYPPEKSPKSDILCHCDGLYLIRNNDNEYVLWNPSRRAHKILRYPYRLESFPGFGIYYDPLVKDYMVVIGDPKHYSVFYCKTNSWSEIKEMNISFKRIPYCSESSPLMGSYYWVCSTMEDRFEIVCFDGREEKFKNLPEIHVTTENLYLTASGDALYLFPSSMGSGVITIMKKVGGNGNGYGGAWMELKVQVPFPCHCLVPLCCTRENKIIVLSCLEGNYLVYDNNKMSFAEIRNGSDLRDFLLFPYVENLFLL